MIDRLTAMSALADPRTPAATLAEIAQGHRDLWVGVAGHHNAYPALLEWLVSQGDPSVIAVVQARINQPVPQPPSPSQQPAPQVAYQPPLVHQAMTRQPLVIQPHQPQPTATVSAGISGVQKAFDSITGFQGEAIVRFRDLFRDTFKRHSKDDVDFLMYSGTKASGLDRTWRLPWLYSRVFFVLLGAYLILWLCIVIFSDSSSNVVPGVIFTGALVMPATVMVFFWEFNQARNVGLFDVIRIFFIGGAMSILLTFIVSAVTDLFQGWGYGVVEAFIEAVFIGFTEEAAKIIVVYLLIRKLYGCLVSNGLLVGAIVGTGFAVFETMGYGTSGWLSDIQDYSDGLMEYILLIRGFLSVGGHVVWTAIAGAALMLAQRKGSTQVSLRTMEWGKFLALFAVPFVLHAIWDFIAFTVESDLQSYLLLSALIVLAWVFIVRLINTGLRQYAELLGVTH